MATAAKTHDLADRKWPEEGVSRIPYWVYTDLNSSLVCRGPLSTVPILV